MIRVFVDTNDLASGLAGYDALTSPAAFVLRAWHERRFDLVASAPIFEELERTLVKPYFEHRLGPFEAKQALSFIGDGANFVTELADVRDVDTMLDYDLILAIAVTDATRQSRLTTRSNSAHTSMQTISVRFPGLLQYPNVQQSNGSHGIIEQETFIFIADRNPIIKEPTLHANRTLLLYRLCIEQEWECPLCRCELPHSPSKLRLELMELDHIQPKSTGGTDANKNLQAVHLRCNREKSNDRHRHNRHRRVQFRQPKYW